jgi:hypothetical protein
MSLFSDKTRELIYHYKKVLKKYLPLTQYNEKIKFLKIKRKNLKVSNEVDLFHAIHLVLKDMEAWFSHQRLPASEFSGIQYFQNHIQDFLQHYTLEQDQVINQTHRASKATIDAIQLLSLPHTETTLEKLRHLISTLKHCGSREQLDMLKNALSKKAALAQDVLSPLLAQLHNSDYIPNPHAS